jgi:hypothetical protein
MKLVTGLVHILVFVMLSGMVFSQVVLEREAYTKQLLSNGIILVSTGSDMSANDQLLLLNNNFNQYRKFKERLKVQLERGPLIELLSISELINQGIYVEPEFIAHKKEEQVNENIKHDIILKLNIGMGYRVKINSEIDN